MFSADSSMFAFLFSDGFKVIASMAAGAFIFFQFMLNHFERVQARKEAFLLSAWSLDYLPKDIQASLEEPMRATLFRHRTGITATAEQRAIYDKTVSSSGNSIGYSELAGNAASLEFKSGKLNVKSYGWSIARAIFFSAFGSILGWIAAQELDIWTATLCAMHLSIALFNWVKVATLWSLQKKLRST